MRRLVTFTSDFGTRDSYVASVKMRILAGDPQTEVIDVTHEIPPFSPALALPPLIDIMAVSPPGTLHLCIVDPGVGSSRKALAGEGKDALFVLPDNGLAALLCAWIEDLRFYHLDTPEIFGGKATPTFQGRDLFSPAVVALTSGRHTPKDLGPLIPTGSLTPHADISPENQLLVWNIDHFGNVLLDYFTLRPPESVAFVHEGRPIPFVRRYQDVSRGSLGCLINSSGWLEVFCREGNAAERTGMKLGHRVTVRVEGGAGRRILSTGQTTP